MLSVPRIDGVVRADVGYRTDGRGIASQYYLNKASGIEFSKIGTATGVKTLTRSCLAANLPDGSTKVECAPGHPSLSVLQRNALTEQIVAVDGITFTEAHRQIAEFLRCDLTGLGGSSAP